MICSVDCWGGMWHTALDFSPNGCRKYRVIQEKHYGLFQKRKLFMNEFVKKDGSLKFWKAKASIFLCWHNSKTILIQTCIGGHEKEITLWAENGIKIDYFNNKYFFSEALMTISFNEEQFAFTKGTNYFHFCLLNNNFKYWSSKTS